MYTHQVVISLAVFGTLLYLMSVPDKKKQYQQQQYKQQQHYKQQQQYYKQQQYKQQHHQQYKQQQYYKQHQYQQQHYQQYKQQPVTSYSSYAEMLENLHKVPDQHMSQSVNQQVYPYIHPLSTQHTDFTNPIGPKIGKNDKNAVKTVFVIILIGFSYICWQNYNIE